MDLLAITAQLFVKNGTASNDGVVPGLLALPSPQKAARGRERDFLFAHLSLSGQLGEADSLATDLIEGLGRRFFNSPGGVTSALRRAVIETNEQLLRHNLGSKSPHEGALSCAVLRGDELYTLQVGEGLVFLGHNFGVERLPVRLPHPILPLGRSAGIDIRFAYHQLQTGDMMLLADPRLAHLSGESLTPVLVGTEIESGLEALMNLVSHETARLLLVEFADELPSTLPVTFQHSKKPAPKSSVSAPAAAPQRRLSAPPVTQPSGNLQPENSSAPSPSASPAGSMSAIPNTHEAVSPVQISARRAATSSARGLSRATAWLASLLDRLRAGEPAEQTVHWAIPTTISLLVPLVMAAVITSVYLQRGTVEQLGTIKARMLEEILLAENASGDLDAMRGHYEAALELAAQADELQPDDPDIVRMRGDVRDALDLVDGVSRLRATTLYRYGENANLTGITLRGGEGGIAVLDKAENRVLFHETDETYRNLTAEEPVIIGFGGQAVGARTIGNLVDIIWLPGLASETRDGIAMLDASGGLFTYYPNLGDVGGLTLDNSSAWVNPLSMATYLDRLYVLDSGARQIWKYYAGDGFTQIADDAAIFFSAEAGLEQAVDFDLYSEDGSLAVVYADGRIRYYDTRSGRVQWDETTLLQSGLSSPLVSPVAVKIVGKGLNASVFVLDSGSGRLVQLSRGGTVLTQYRALDDSGNEILSRATDFAVSESPLSILVVAGNRIYLAQRE